MQSSIMTSDVEVKVLKVTSVDSSSLLVMPCLSYKDKATVSVTTESPLLSTMQASLNVNPSIQIVVFSEAVYKS